MDLIFTGERGEIPDEDSVDYDVLLACSSPEGWEGVIDVTADEFEGAITRLKQLGWGFELVLGGFQDE